MEEVAQGRVWTGNDAASRGLVDAIGGLSRAVAIAKQKANLPMDEQVTLIIRILIHKMCIIKILYQTSEILVKHVPNISTRIKDIALAQEKSK